MAGKRDRAPGKRKIKEKIDADYYFEDSDTVSTNKSFDKKQKDNSTPSPATTTNLNSTPPSKRKYRPKNKTKKCLNKELLELKIELQEKQQRLQADNSTDLDQSNLFFTNTPSTSSASESAFAENAEFGTDFHNYEERKYRDSSPFSFDDYPYSNTIDYFNDSSTSTDKKKKKSSASNKKSSNSSFNQSPSSTTNKRQRLINSEHTNRNINSPTFLNTPITTGGYSTPSRKSIVLRDGFVFSANNDVNSSNISPLSLHALEKPIPNTILPFWDARLVREIHESDDVDELVHCICDFKEESGLMIQCECSLTWSHGS